MKATSLRFSLDQIQANNNSRCSSGVRGSSLKHQLCALIHCQSASVLLLKLAIPGNSGNLGSVGGGSGTLWSSCGGDGRSTGVVVPEVVTPVTIELLLGVWTIKSSSIW